MARRVPHLGRPAGGGDEPIFRAAATIRAMPAWPRHAHDPLRGPLAIGLVLLLGSGCGLPPGGESTEGGSGGGGTGSSTTPGATAGLGTTGDATGPGGDEAGSSSGTSTGAAGCALTDQTRLALDSGMAVVHHDGQTFVSWADREQGAAGAAYRYRLYRSATPIASDDDLAGAELVASGILDDSGQLFGDAFTPPARLDDTQPMAIVETDGDPLAPWSGLWVATAEADACAFYAVLATDVDDQPVESIMPGVNATVDPVAERVADRQPLEVWDSTERGIYVPETEITGTPNLPLRVVLHASDAQGGGAGDYGDYWLYFGDDSMASAPEPRGVLGRGDPQRAAVPHDAQPRHDRAPGAARPGSRHVVRLRRRAGRGAPRLPYTEARLLWMIPWVIDHYAVDPERVYLVGGSMGAWGSMTFGLRHPELFAAVFPNRPRFRQTTMTSGGIGGHRRRHPARRHALARAPRLDRLRPGSPRGPAVSWAGAWGVRTGSRPGRSTSTWSRR